MTKLSRRHLVVGGLAGAGATAIPGFIQEANAATATRYNLASPNGQAMLKKYAEAVKLMTALPPSDPRSWTFQWYTHAVPTNTTKAAALTQIFGPNPSANKSLATQMWNTCQGHFAASDEPYFLPWHRMYVCYFEEIIRAVLKDPKFTLPYWNYTVPAGYAVPKEFRMQNDPLWGPLYRPNRNPTSNAGQPIFAAGGSASDLSPAPAMAETQYLPSGAVSGFDQTLDFGLHGNVHVFTGNGQGMGQIPWAANDPIFWMHHCNIDRIWVSWNNAGHANPNTAAWLGKVFVFAGPAPASPSAAPAASPLSSRLSALPENHRLYLVINDFKADIQPETLFRVYLDLPDNPPSDPVNSHYVGSFNFFAAVPHGDEHDHADTARTLSFDITDIAADLNAKSLLKAEHAVTIVPAKAPVAEAKPVVGGISFVEQ